MSFKTRVMGKTKLFGLRIGMSGHSQLSCVRNSTQHIHNNVIGRVVTLRRLLLTAMYNKFGFKNKKADKTLQKEDA